MVYVVLFKGFREPLPGGGAGCSKFVHLFRVVKRGQRGALALVAMDGLANCVEGCLLIVSKSSSAS
jgi:hypothetical protein